tara:strand:+ start:540 stop:962 length:423 start_codon:yes stop_codon:yes gene_type:complete
MRNKERYNKEIKSLRKLLSDNQYTRTLSTTYHGFLNDMHMKLIGDGNVTPKMIKSIETAIHCYGNYNRPDIKIQRDNMLAKITKLKYLLSQCGYTQQYEREKMEFLDSITSRAHSRGNLTPKQAKYANTLYKQFNKRILP